MNHRIEEHDLLAWIEGELAPERARLVEAALDADPGLRAWAEATMRDRAALRASGAEAEASAPRGLVDDAIAIVERRALVGADASHSGASRRRLRLTPVRMAIAASLLMGVSMLSLWPLLTGSFSPGKRASHSPVAEAPSPTGEEGPVPGSSPTSAVDMPSLAMRDASENDALPSSDLLKGAAPVVADADTGWDGRITVSAEHAATQTDSARVGAARSEDPASGGREAQITMSDEQAVLLARQGRLALLVESTDLALAERRVRSLLEREDLSVSLRLTSARDAGRELGSALIGGELPDHADARRLIHYTLELEPTGALLAALEAALHGDGVRVRRIELPDAIQAFALEPDAPGDLNRQARSAILPVVVIRPHAESQAGSGDDAGTDGSDGSR